MSIWTAGTLLDLTQELIGEPVGGFYNTAMRLAQMNAFQRELVEETRALTAEEKYDLVAGTATVTLPEAFLTFDLQSPYLLEDTTYRGNVQVKPTSFLDTAYPGWQADEETGYPRFLVLRGETLTLYPIPQDGLTLVLPYVPTPANMSERSDLPFDGNERLNRFAPALAYITASSHLMMRNPPVSNALREYYQREVRAMRSAVRSNPQYRPRVRQVPRR